MIPDIYRPSPQYPTYPPYHTGLYLEDYFYEWSKGKTFKREYIPIFWTTLYCDNHMISIQNILDRLPQDREYFTICQHDDAPKERLPRGTKVFASGGRNLVPNMVQLPSICSKIPNPILNKPRDIFASFIGVHTHPIRNKMMNVISNYADYHAKMIITHEDRIQNFNTFKDITERSKFTLCPRGYGRSSLRLYECMQLGSVPVYISDYHYLPFTDELDWSKFCVLVNENQLPNIDTILRSIDDDQYESMKKYAQQIYDKYFTLLGVCEQIEKRI
jgi:hypothetical protein